MNVSANATRLLFADVIVTSGVPEPTSWDYIHIAFNAICCFIGLPVNIATFYWLRRRRRKGSDAVIVLHQHLNFSDLLVLLVLCLCRSVWLYTYGWVFGDVLCRLMRYLESVSLSIVSNTLVCIGLNRLYSLRHPLLAKLTAQRRIRWMVRLSWMMATMACLPQLFVWRVYEHRFENGQRFTQCVSSWVAHARNNDTYEGMELEYELYDAYLLVVIFWIPFLILITCYGAILIHAHQFLNQQLVGSPLNTDLIDEDKKPSVPSNQLGTQEPMLRLRRSTAGGHSQQQISVRKSKVKALRVTLVLMLAYLLCYVPCNVLMVWAKVDTETYRRVETYLYFLHFLIAINSVVNPFIYNRDTICCGKTRGNNNHSSKRPQHQPRRSQKGSKRVEEVYLARVDSHRSVTVETTVLPVVNSTTPVSSRLDSSFVC